MKEFDTDFDAYHPYNRMVGAALGLEFCPRSDAWVDAFGQPVRNKYGEPLS